MVRHKVPSVNLLLPSNICKFVDCFRGSSAVTSALVIRNVFWLVRWNTNTCRLWRVRDRILLLSNELSFEMVRSQSYLPVTCRCTRLTTFSRGEKYVVDGLTAVSLLAALELFYRAS